LEEAINGVEGLRYITSTSTNAGISTITCTFNLGTNLDIAAADVQNAVGTANALLPAEVRHRRHFPSSVKNEEAAPHLPHLGADRSPTYASEARAYFMRCRTRVSDFFKNTTSGVERDASPAAFGSGRWMSGCRFYELAVNRHRYVTMLSSRSPAIASLRAPLMGGRSSSVRKDRS
jgi:AcrB/AcrD/AcrF family